VCSRLKSAIKVKEQKRENHFEELPILSFFSSFLFMEIFPPKEIG
jgi:hypothetical protein